MDRRSFLRLTVRGRERVIDLSCERLYMRWADARARVGALPAETVDPVEVVVASRAHATHAAAGAAATAAGGATASAPWVGEPPLEVDVPTVDDLFAEIDRRMEGADVLRVGGREWLADEGFRAALESRIEAFRRRGGRVE